MYKIRLEKVDDDGNSTVVFENDCDGVAMLAKSIDGSGFHEVFHHMDILECANMIANGKQFFRSAKLAMHINDAYREAMAEGSEDALMNLLGFGGNNDEENLQ